MSTAPRVSAAKRDWGHDTSGCNILHIDMDAFYASIEMARHPELLGKPIIIGNGPRSVVSAASYEARAYGVNSAMPTSKAHRLCPNGIFLPVDMPYYQLISQKIFDEIFSKITNQIEKVSVDECYMDVSSALLHWNSPIKIGSWIRTEVENKFHLTCSVGIASNKLIAKMASTNAKPNGMLLIPKSQNINFVSIMPLRAIPGIGSTLSRTLSSWGINDIATLRTIDETTLKRATGSSSSAHMLYQAARGIDERPVINNAPEKSIGTERTLDYDTTDIESVNKLLRYCCNEVARSLRKRELVAYTVTLKLRFSDLHYSTRSHTLRNATDSANELYKQVIELLNSLNPQINNAARDISNTKSSYFSKNKISIESQQKPYAQTTSLYKQSESAHSQISPENTLATNENTLAEKRLLSPIRLAGVSVSNLKKSIKTFLQPSIDDIYEEQKREPSFNNSTYNSANSQTNNSTHNSAQSTNNLNKASRIRCAEHVLDAVKEKYGENIANLGI